jgi:hypothetical protein
LRKAAGPPEWAKRGGHATRAGNGHESPFRIVGAS